MILINCNFASENKKEISNWLAENIGKFNKTWTSTESYVAYGEKVSCDGYLAVVRYNKKPSFTNGPIGNPQICQQFGFLYEEDAALFRLVWSQ